MGRSESANSSIGRGSLMIIAAVVLVVPVLSIGLFAALARTDDIDAFLYAYYAKRMLAGQRLYADLWDNKPPGVFWADGLGLLVTGGRWLGVVLMCSLAAVGSCVMFFLTARRLYGVGPAAVGVVMASLYIFLHDYHVGGNRPNTFYVFFELCVMAAYVHACGRGHGGWWLYAAGVAAFASVMFRQTAFAASAAAALHQMLIALTGRQTRAALARNAAAFLGGLATGAAIVTTLLWATSDLSFAWHGIVTSNIGYFAQTGKSQWLPRELFRWEDHLQVLGLPLILAVGAIIYEIVTLGSSRSRQGGAQRSESPPAAFALVALWFPIALYLALVGPSKRMMYFGVALPPLVMLATHGVWLLLREEREMRRARFSVVLAVLWFAFMMVPGVRRQWDGALIAQFQRFDDRASSRHEHTVRAIHRHTGPEDPIYMWGYLPAVYWYADRPQAQRYIVTTLIDQWGSRAQPCVDAVIEDLRRYPPKAIILGPRELRTIEQPSNDHPIDYGDFARWLRAHYAVPADCKSRNVWIRRD